MSSKTRRRTQEKARQTQKTDYSPPSASCHVSIGAHETKELLHVKVYTMEKRIAQDVFLCSDDQAVMDKLLHFGLLTKFFPTDQHIKAICLPYIEYVRTEQQTLVNAYAFFCFTHVANASQGDYSYVKICDIATCTHSKVRLLCELISNALGPLSRIEVQPLFPLN